MTKWKRHAVLFTVGGAGYGLLELLWRGRTHWSMLVAGGVCFTLFTKIAVRCRRRSLLYKAAACSACVTAVELLFGLVFNKLLKRRVWDYSDMPLNFMGQICPAYSALWGVLGVIFLPFAAALDRKLKNKRG